MLARPWGGRLCFGPGRTERGRDPTGLPRDHPESYHSFMWNNFFKHTDIHPENTHILDGNAADLQAECDAFEEKIKAAGGIELFVGGELGTLRRGGQTWPGRHACLSQTAASLCASASARPSLPWEAGKAEGPPAPCPASAQQLCDLGTSCTSMHVCKWRAVSLGSKVLSPSLKIL